MAGGRRDEEMAVADDRPDDWPSGVAAPARRALAAAGYTGLEQLAAAQVDDLAALHGIGRRPCGTCGSYG